MSSQYYFEDFPAMIEASIGPNGIGLDGQHTEQWDRLQRLVSSPIGEKLPFGDWQPLLDAGGSKDSWRLGFDWLNNQSKDLHVCVWTVSWLFEHKGFLGLSIGLKGLLRWLEKWWLTGYPAIQARLPNDDDQLATNLAIREGLFDWLDRRILGLFRFYETEYGLTESEFSQIHEASLLCEDIASWLDTHVKAWDGAPIRARASWFIQMREWLHLKKPVDIKKRSLLDEASPGAMMSADINAEIGPQSVSHTKVFVDRQDALRCLKSVMQFFAAHEPSGPLVPMLQRALELAEQPVDVWLMDLVDDVATRRRLADTLGLRV